MEIGKPVKEVPGGLRNKYNEIYRRVKEATPDWLPLTFPERASALRFRSGLQKQFTRRRLGAALRGNVVYLRYLDGAQPQ